jgi:hypothetical protein
MGRATKWLRPVGGCFDCPQKGEMGEEIVVDEGMSNVGHQEPPRVIAT